MNEIVFKSAKGNPVTTSLIVAEKFGKQHKHVLDAIRSMNSSAENSAQFFYLSSYKDSSGKSNDMFMMNRDGFSLLVMGFTGEKALKFKIAFIEAFNQMEIAAKTFNPSTLSRMDILKMAMEAETKVLVLEAENKKLAQKADFADRVIDTDNMVDIGQAAKLLKLNYGRNNFFKELKSKGIFFKSRNEPKQEYIDRGYFELRQKTIQTNTHGSFSVTKILVNQKGLFWLSKQFGTTISNSFPVLNLQ